MALFSLYPYDIGTALTFTLTSAAPTVDTPATALTLSAGAVVIWRTDDGIKRTLSLVSALSGMVQYVVSFGDFPAPGLLRGHITVSFGTNRFRTSAFLITLLEG